MQDRIGDWQAECVKLEVQTMKQALSTRRDAQIGDSVRALHEQVSEQAKMFEETVAKAPEPIRVHSRVTDTRMVLRLLEERLARMMADDSGPAKGRR
jgi:hypothetical protein